MAAIKPNSLLLLVSLALFLALSSACSLGGATYTGPTDECGPVEPSPQDVRFALEFGQTPFNQPDWVKSYTVEPYRVTLTRQNNREGAVTYLEYLMYNCGYGQLELNEYFSDEGFAIVFANYESYALYNFCESEDQNLALYEFELEDAGEVYAARYWVQQVSETRLLVYQLVFPSNQMFVMNGYAEQIFPDLVACGGP
jgi:hypothetical protein